MKYHVISADCHIDLIWLPPDLFTANASAHLRDRMPYVTNGEDGPQWVSRSGSNFGLNEWYGFGRGRRYVPGQIHRSDRMASTGLYEDGRRGIRRLTDPDLRLRDQDLDGVQGEVLYGILGATSRLNDPEAATEVIRIYNQWLADFCDTHPERFAGIACVPGHNMSSAIEELKRVGKRGSVRGVEIPLQKDMTPLWDPYWEPLWAAVKRIGPTRAFSYYRCWASRDPGVSTAGAAGSVGGIHHWVWNPDGQCFDVNDFFRAYLKSIRHYAS